MNNRRDNLGRGAGLASSNSLSAPRKLPICKNNSVYYIQG